MELSLRRCLVLVVCGLALVRGDAGGGGDGADGHTAAPPGAPVRLSVSDPGLLSAVRFAEGRYNMLSNGMHIRKVSKILSATRQVRHCTFVLFYSWDHV